MLYEVRALPITCAVVTNAGCHKNIMLANLTAQIALDSADGHGHRYRPGMMSQTTSPISAALEAPPLGRVPGHART